MSEVTQSAPAEQAATDKPSFLSKLTTIARRIAGLVFWTYLIAKVFIFDIDRVIVGIASPDLQWVVDLRFVIFIAIAAILAATTSVKSVLLTLSYILFFPLIVLFFYIPLFVGKRKSWVLAFAFLNAVLSLFLEVRYRIISLAFYTFGFTLAALTKGAIFVESGVVLLYCAICISYVRAFHNAFRASRLFRAYSAIFARTQKFVQHAYKVDDDLKGVELITLTPKQVEKWSNNLQISVLYNRLCLYAASKMRDYQNSQVIVISGIWRTLSLFLLTVVAFATINASFFRIEATSFRVDHSPDWFTFMYYSFNNMLNSSISDLDAASLTTQASSIFQKFLSMLLLVIFASIILAVRSQKHSRDLDQAILRIEAEGERMEAHIRVEYKVGSIADAMAELEKVKASLLQVLTFLSRR